MATTHRSNLLARPELPRPTCRVVLVCGPPASGKSSYVRDNAKPEDIVIDLDLIAREKGFGRVRPSKAIAGLLAERNKRLAALSREAKNRVCWFIISAPGAGLRRWWSEALNVQPSDVILLTPSREELRRRILADPDRHSVQALHFGLVDKWILRERENNSAHLDPLSHKEHGEPRQWYTTYRWKQRRLAQLREHPLCGMCASKGRVTVATVVDHIVPHRGDWNAFWLNKCQSVCKPCHDSAKRYEELRGYDRAIGEDGWPTDPRHPTYR